MALRVRRRIVRGASPAKPPAASLREIRLSVVVATSCRPGELSEALMTGLHNAGIEVTSCSARYARKGEK